MQQRVVSGDGREAGANMCNSVSYQMKAAGLKQICAAAYPYQVMGARLEQLCAAAHPYQTLAATHIRRDSA
ncbi:hypothetical protein DQG13_13615 [Paenibacillus sp. YN15]|nr:hypothetical protein DQG13_13615 [Paenibacillus sp. YN15]